MHLMDSQWVCLPVYMRGKEQPAQQEQGGITFHLLHLKRSLLCLNGSKTATKPLSTSSTYIFIFNEHLW